MTAITPAGVALNRSAGLLGEPASRPEAAAPTVEPRAGDKVTLSKEAEAYLAAQPPPKPFDVVSHMLDAMTQSTEARRELERMEEEAGLDRKPQPHPEAAPPPATDGETPNAYPLATMQPALALEAAIVAA